VAAAEGKVGLPMALLLATVLLVAVEAEVAAVEGVLLQLPVIPELVVMLALRPIQLPLTALA